MGLTFFNYYDNYPWSWQFITIEIVIIIVGRLLGTAGLIYLLTLFGHKKSVNLREIIFIGYAGMIRGAIAFGLVLRLEEYEGIDPNSREIITTTALTLVVFTTIVFGSLMPLVQRLLVPAKEEPEKHEEAVQAREAAFSVQHEEFLHPNLLKEEDEMSRTHSLFSDG